MTKSKPSMEEPVSDLPAYTSQTTLSTSRGESLDEKMSEESKPQLSCCCTSQSSTPHIDAQLRNPRLRPHMLALSAALADENSCAKCSLENVAESLTLFAKELKSVKEGGEWSKEEKKALKKEAKGLAKGIKRDVRRMWKSK